MAIGPISSTFECHGCKPCYTVTWDTCAGDEPVSEKVKRLEQELADAKAKLAAEAEKKKPTKGEVLAASLYNYATTSSVQGEIDFRHRVYMSGFDHKGFAAAIDKALADERERCAKGLDEVVAEHDRVKTPNCGDFWDGTVSGFRRSARIIRDL